MKKRIVVRGILEYLVILNMYIIYDVWVWKFVVEYLWFGIIWNIFVIY